MNVYMIRIKASFFVMAYRRYTRARKTVRRPRFSRSMKYRKF